MGVSVSECVKETQMSRRLDALEEAEAQRWFCWCSHIITLNLSVGPVGPAVLGPSGWGLLSIKQFFSLIYILAPL